MRLLWLGLLYCYLSCRMILCAITHMAFPVRETVQQMSAEALSIEWMGPLDSASVRPTLFEWTWVYGYSHTFYTWRSNPVTLPSHGVVQHI